MVRGKKFERQATTSERERKEREIGMGSGRGGFKIKPNEKQCLLREFSPK